MHEGPCTDLLNVYIYIHTHTHCMTHIYYTYYETYMVSTVNYPRQSNPVLIREVHSQN